MRGVTISAVMGCAFALWIGSTSVCNGQAPPNHAPQALFSLTVRDGSVRAALTELFEAARVQYSIDQRVTGFETLHITDQSFDGALRILLRSSSQPLIYTKENGVYYVSVREPIPVTRPGVNPVVPETSAPPALHVDVLTLTHADPYDLAGLLGIKIVPFGTRFGGIGSAGGAGGTPNGTGSAKGNAGGPSGPSGSSVVNAGTLISNDVDNDIVRIGE